MSDENNNNDDKLIHDGEPSDMGGSPAGERPEDDADYVAPQKDTFALLDLKTQEGADEGDDDEAGEGDDLDGAEDVSNDGGDEAGEGSDDGDGDDADAKDDKKDDTDDEIFIDYSSVINEAEGELNDSDPTEFIKALRTNSDGDGKVDLSEIETMSDMTPTQYKKFQQETQREVNLENETTRIKNSEIKDVKVALQRCATNLKVTQAEAELAIKRANQFGFDNSQIGEPTKWGRMVVRELRTISMEKQIGKRTTKAGRDEAERIRKAKLKSQPSKSSSSPAKKPTENNKRLQAMRKVAPKTTLSLLDKK